MRVVFPHKFVINENPTVPPPPPPPDGQPDWITFSHHDTVPNFGKNPTIKSIQNGLWSNPATWDLNRVPIAGDVVNVNNNVTYDVVSDAAIDTVSVRFNRLDFLYATNTRLTTRNLLVLDGAALRIGDTTNPVTALAEIVITDTAINLAQDPESYGTSILGIGTVTMCGKIRQPTFARLATAPAAGATTLTLAESVTGWVAGDQLLLPDSRAKTQAEWDSITHSEIATIQSISGFTITLTAPLTYAHPYGVNELGVANNWPHVANITRNVLIRSANPNGTRGHILVAGRADVDFRYVEVRDLGRTTNDQWDNTKFTVFPNVLSYGTNQRGRYPVHIHHVYGVTPPTHVYQFTVMGNSIYSNLSTHNFRWGMSVHDSHWGLVEQNVVHNMAGWGIGTEAGNETETIFHANFTSRIFGTEQRGDNRMAQDDFGMEGTGYWYGGTNIRHRNNVSVECREYGVNYMATGRVSQSAHIPLAQGNDPEDPGEYVLVNPRQTALLEFNGHEDYGSKIGATFWNINDLSDVDTAAESLVNNLLVWNPKEGGMFGYIMYRFTFVGMAVYGDPGKMRTEFTYGTNYSDYLTVRNIMRNTTVVNCTTGLEVPSFAGSIEVNGPSQRPFTIETAYLRCTYNLSLKTPWAQTGGVNLTPRITNATDVTFVTPAFPVSDGPFDVYMGYLSNSTNPNLIILDQCFLYNAHGTQTGNNQVYYAEQLGSFVVPMSDPSTGLIAAPVAGLTNTQLWAQYGLAVAGAVAPVDAVANSKIHGLIRSF